MGHYTYFEHSFEVSITESSLVVDINLHYLVSGCLSPSRAMGRGSVAFSLHAAEPCDFG